MTVPEHSHGRGWAGIPRYVARERIRWRMAHRAGRIDGLYAAASVGPGESSDLLDRANRLEAEQAADGDLLAGLLHEPLLPSRPHRSTYNGEDDHVRGDR